MEFRFERDRVVTHNTTHHRASALTDDYTHDQLLWMKRKNKSVGFWHKVCMGRFDEITTNTVTCQCSGTHVLLEITEQQDKIHLTIPDVRDQSFGKWQYTSTETINVHTGPAVCLVPFIRHPLSFDLVCHHSLYLTHLNHVHGIEMLWKIDSIIIQSIAAQKKDVTRLSLSPMLFEVQMVCTFL